MHFPLWEKEGIIKGGGYGVRAWCVAGGILLGACCCCGLVPFLPPTPPAVTPDGLPAGGGSVVAEGAVEYDVWQTVTLSNDGAGDATRILLRVALVRDLAPYQEVTSLDVAPGVYDTTTDEYGNVYAEFEFEDVAPGAEVTAELSYRVVVNGVDLEIGACEGTLPGEFVDAELYVESDARPIVALAEELGGGAATVCDEVRAFYDYVGDEVSYTGYNPDSMGALAVLDSMGGDCTDFADLMIALSRAAGVPARFVEGVTCCTDGEYVEGDTKHDWLEVYLPGTGWAPMDPTWGRFAAKRETYFAGMTPDHIVVTVGRNLSALEGYHYYYYEYWWEDESTDVSSREEWGIVRVDD